jgi:hypothetical protein
MRAGRSGIYVSPTGALGFNVCMLDRTVMSSHYRDPYLSAIRQQSGVVEFAVDGAVAQNRADGPWFTGYETEARWMRLRASGVKIQCLQDGFLLNPPEDPAHSEAFGTICEAHGIGPDLRLKVPHVIVDGRQLDTHDRVQLGAALLRDLVATGL